MTESTRSYVCNIVCLEVPSKIECRDIALRTVSAACKLIISDARTSGSGYSEFTAHVVSAVGEAYNNIVLHGYAGLEPGIIHIQIENYREGMRVMITDMGVSFDPMQARPPDLDALPESGLGIFIMRSFMDEITYAPGPPNVLTLYKRLDGIDGEGINCPRPSTSKSGL